MCVGEIKFKLLKYSTLNKIHLEFLGIFNANIHILVLDFKKSKGFFQNYIGKITLKSHQIKLIVLKKHIFANY